MTRYFVFVCPHYEAAGGMDDCTGVFDTLEEAKAAAVAAQRDYVTVSIAEIGEEMTEHWMREGNWVSEPFVPSACLWVQTQDA
jgi:hypothetical protein